MRNKSVCNLYSVWGYSFKKIKKMDSAKKKLVLNVSQFWLNRTHIKLGFIWKNNKKDPVEDLGFSRSVRFC